MNFRRPAAAAAVIALAAIGLSACSTDSDADASASPSTSASGDTSAQTVAALESVTWTDGADGVPVLEYDPELSFTDTGAILHQDGDGEEVADGAGVQISYVVYAATSRISDAGTSPSPSPSDDADDSGLSVFQSTYETGFKDILTVSQTTLDPNLYAALDGAHIGAQILFGSVDTSTGTPLVMALTLENPLALQAEGEAVEPAEDLPTVTLDENGAPTIDMSTAADEPTELVSQTLIEGDGAEVEEGQIVTIQYTGALWDGTVFDSTWERGFPTSFPLESPGLIDGWVQGLPGAKVGSQVLLVIPSDLGYGDEGSQSIPGGATLVFVIDILAAQDQ